MVRGPDIRPTPYPRLSSAKGEFTAFLDDVLPVSDVTISPPHVSSVLAPSITISVSGSLFHLLSPSASSIERAIGLAESYRKMLCPAVVIPSLPLHESLPDRFQRLQSVFSPAAAEADALADANNFTLSEDVLNRDRDLLGSLGSIDALVEYFASRHKVSGLNEDRVKLWLSKDPNFAKLMSIAATGAEVDTDSKFSRHGRKVPLRAMHRRLLPVYRKHAHKMWSQGKALLLRLSDLSAEQLASLHIGNDCHWTPKPMCPLGRFLIDCSNAGPGGIPLNSPEAKQKGIDRYQKVSLPTIREILTSWDIYRITHNLPWADLRIFKEDVSGCFNQLNWSSNAAKLLCAMIDDDVIYIMLTGGFGHCVTPMVWSLFGEAITRRVLELARCPVHTFVDDSFGAGILAHALEARDLIQSTTRGVIGPSAISVEKSVLDTRAEILGFLIDLIKGTIRPKDKALDKIFYVMFRIETSIPQPLEMWQCVASIAEFYSPALRGMKAFVAPLHHMSKLCSHRRHGGSGLASPSAAFAIEVWRAAAVLLAYDKDALSVSLDSFVLNRESICDVTITSDASPWRLAAAIHDPVTRRVVAWSTILLPFAQGNENRFHVQREYLGHLFSIILLVAHSAALSGSIPSKQLSYRWINDNTGALKWAAAHKCSSAMSQFACLAVTRLVLTANVDIMDSVYLPGKDMGEIDAMSRREIHVGTLHEVCPSLLSNNFINLDGEPIVDLFRLCDPAGQLPASKDHHTVFRLINSRVEEILTFLRE